MTQKHQPIRFPVEVPPAPGKSVELAEGVIWIRFPLPMRPDHVNIYALDDGDGWTIVDTGINSRKGHLIWEELLNGPLHGKKVHRVVATHHHPDHMGLAGWFQTELGAELWTTRTAWLMARMLTLDVQEVWPAETRAFYKGAGMAPELLQSRSEERPFNFADVVAPMPLGYRRIAQGDVIEMGGRTWDVHIGNGHAPEHATFWSRDDDLVLAGDQIIPGISSNLGVYPTEPQADPVGDWFESCTRLLGLAEERHLALPGHKLPFHGVPMRLQQMIDNHHHALERLDAYLSEPRTAADCFQPLFLREIGEREYGLALVEAIGHLNHMLGQGSVVRERRADGVWLWSRP